MITLRLSSRPSNPPLQTQGRAHQTLLLVFDFPQVFTDALDVCEGRLAGLLRETAGHGVVQASMLAVDLTLLRLTMIEVVDRGIDRVEQQVGERAQGLHQHRIMRSLTDRQMEGVIQASVFTGFKLPALGRHQSVIASCDQNKIRIGAAQGRKPRRFAFQQAAYFKQVIQGARLRTEQMHQRRYLLLAVHVRDKRPFALLGFDNPPRPQQLQPFAQGCTGNAKLFGQATLGGQELPHFQDAIDDQPLDTFTDHIRHLCRPRLLRTVHPHSNWYDQIQGKTDGEPNQ